MEATDAHSPADIKRAAAIIGKAMSKLGVARALHLYEVPYPAGSEDAEAGPWFRLLVVVDDERYRQFIDHCIRQRIATIWLRTEQAAQQEYWSISEVTAGWAAAGVNDIESFLGTLSGHELVKNGKTLGEIGNEMIIARINVVPVPSGWTEKFLTALTFSDAIVVPVLPYWHEGEWQHALESYQTFNVKWGRFVDPSR